MNVPKLRFKEFNDEWIETKIQNVATIIGGGTPSTDEPKYWGNEINWFTPSEIGKTKYVTISNRKISQDGLKNSSAKLLPKGTILLSSRATVGEASILLNEASTNQGFQSLIVNENNCNEFIYYLKYKYKREMLIKSFGSTFLEISKSNVENIKIKIPSKEEQFMIANFLSLLDKKIELQSKKIEDLKLFTKKLETQYIFNSNDEYNKKRIDEIFNVKTGGDLNKSNISFIKTPLFCYPIYSNNLEMNGLYGYSDIYKIEEESITVTGRGDIGKAIKREGKYYPIVRLLVLIPKISVNLIYMQEAVNNLKLIQESTGVPQLTAPQISKYKVSYPTLDIQNKYGDILLLLQEKIRYEIRKIEKLHQQKKGLMQNMFV